MEFVTILGLTTYTFEVYTYVFTIAAKNAEDAKKCATVKLLDERIIDDKNHQFEWLCHSKDRFYMFEQNIGD